MDWDPLSLFVWVVVGAIAGWLAFKFAKGHSFTQRGGLLVGVLGASIGGFLLKRFDVVSASLSGDALAGVAGAVFLLLVVGLLKGS